MKLTKKQLDQLTMGIQAVLGILVIGLSVRNSAKIQTAQMKKLARQDARQQSKLQKSQYKLQKKLLKEKFKQKLQRAKKVRGGNISIL